MFNKSHLVHLNIIMHICHCQNTLSCFFQRVMQITHFHIRVQKYDILFTYFAQPVCRSCEFRRTPMNQKLPKSIAAKKDIGKQDFHLEFFKTINLKNMCSTLKDHLSSIDLEFIGHLISNKNKEWWRRQTRLIKYR